MAHGGQKKDGLGFACIEGIGYTKPMEKMEKRSVLIADDEFETISELKDHLDEAGYDIHIARDGYTALSKACVVAPDVILIDLTIPGLRGIEVKNRLNRESTTFDIPVIFMADHPTTDQKIESFNLKADDVVSKPLNLPELMARIDALSIKHRERDQVMATDALTGLGNLHIFKRSLSQLFNIAKRYDRPFSLAVFDIDDFKLINDKYGHSVGDHAIRALAQLMKKSFRETDILVRYGGDEFVALFPETDEVKAKEGIQRFRDNIKAFTMPLDSKKMLQFSVSLGLATFQQDLKHATDIFEIADQRMYAEKKTRPNPSATRASIEKNTGIAGDFKLGR